MERHYSNSIFPNVYRELVKQELKRVENSKSSQPKEKKKILNKGGK